VGQCCEIWSDVGWSDLPKLRVCDGVIDLPRQDAAWDQFCIFEPNAQFCFVCISWSKLARPLSV
jgi:hypothetical protein